MVPFALKTDFVTYAEIYNNDLDYCGVYDYVYDAGGKNGEGICEWPTNVGSRIGRQYLLFWYGGEILETILNNGVRGHVPGDLRYSSDRSPLN